MKKSKKIISVVVAAILLFCNVLTIYANDVLSGEAINKNLLQRIEFSYFSQADSTTTCYYTNDYFSESAYIYNQSLATMSLSLAFSAFGSIDGEEGDYTQKSSNARELLEKIGVPSENIEVNSWFNVKPTEDSAAVVAGNMPIKVNNEEYTLVAIAVRGAGYEKEWASNFTIGTVGQHQGFSEGKEIVLDFLKEYFKNQDISGNVKLWITGYSRGAAIANLVSGAIDDGEVLDDDITYTLDDVYAYTFETPAGALTVDVEGVSKYENIFNIINPNDPVPFVAPVDMGFGRYGVDIYTPTAESDPESYESYKARMLEFYFDFEGVTTYTVDDFQMKKLGLKNWLPGGQPIEYIVDDTENDYSQNVFLSNYVSILAKEFIVDRETYLSYYENEIREICSVMFGCSGEQQKIFLDAFIAQAQANWGALAWSYVINAVNPWGKEEDALKMISDWLKTAINEAGITDYDEAVIDSAGISLGDLMLALVTSHPNYFSTAVMNAEKLAEAHFPELCFAWMKSLDSNYISDTAEYTLNKNAYRIVYVDGLADVSVYKENGTIVASLVDGKVISIDGYDYSYGIDNGVKYVILPIDQMYSVLLNNVEGDISYTVKEYNSSVGYTRVVEFDSVSSNELITGSVPSYSAEEIESGAPYGSTVDYSLSIASENIIKNTDISRNSEFSVDASSSDENYGTVNGSKTYKYGENAVISAEASYGCEFIGWYENDVLVSESAVFEINVYENHSFVALFECKELTPKAENGVSVVDGKIYGMWDKLTLEDSKELFEDSDVLESSSNGYIGTGTEIKYYNKIYTVIIIGDVDGDGQISSTDYMRIKSNFIGTLDLNELFMKSSDVDGDGTLTSTDYLRIKSYFLNTFQLFDNKTA